MRMISTGSAFSGANGSSARRRVARRCSVLGISVLAVALGAVLPGGRAFASADPHQGASAGIPDFGPNGVIFSPSMSQADIPAKVNAIYAQQANKEMGTARYALLFDPAAYGPPPSPLETPVGY